MNIIAALKELVGDLRKQALNKSVSQFYAAGLRAAAEMLDSLISRLKSEANHSSSMMSEETAALADFALEQQAEASAPAGDAASTLEACRDVMRNYTTVEGAALYRRIQKSLASLSQERRLAEMAISNQMPPVCPTHRTQMVLTFYMRGPSDPPGNSWVCRECDKARATVKEGK